MIIIGVISPQQKQKQLQLQHKRDIYIYHSLRNK